MALYKYPQILEQSNDQAFDFLHVPGALAPFSGIYRCEECGKEETSVRARPLPPQNHHQHAVTQGPIRWRFATASLAQEWN